MTDSAENSLEAASSVALREPEAKVKGDLGVANTYVVLSEGKESASCWQLKTLPPSLKLLLVTRSQRIWLQLISRAAAEARLMACAQIETTPRETTQSKAEVG